MLNTVISYGRCEKTGKVKMKSKKDAKIAIKKLKIGNKNGGNPMAHYKCEYCNHYHVGSKVMDGEIKTRHEHRNANR